MCLPADDGQEGGAMLTNQQIIHRTLECMWALTDKGLACHWVAREAEAQMARLREAEEAQRKVA